MTTIAEVIEELESKGIRVTGDEDKAAHSKVRSGAGQDAAISSC